MKSKMFPFNKPKVYRSSEGCCICRAKTSSSRFIESKKYEKDAVKCFLLDHPRKGEICNACVLLVKRFKRLPDGSNKNWGHVVDTRSGVVPSNTTKTPSTTNAIVCVAPTSITTTVPTLVPTPISSTSTIYTSSTTSVSSSKSSTSSSSTSSSSSSLLPEKFAKIFKKTTKKSKSSHSSKGGGGDSNKMGAHSKKSSRVAASHHHHHHHHHNNNNYEINHNSQITAIPTTESMTTNGDDCEDSHYTVPSSNLQNGNIVEFQTETRASYRARKSSSSSSLKTNAINGANSISDSVNGGQGRRRPLTKMGCKRRKCFMPRKRQKLWDEEEIKKEFYDTNEWLPKKTCCGIIYECSLFKQSIMLKTDEFKPCLEHSIKKESSSSSSASASSSSSSTSAAIQQIKRETAIVTGIQRPIATVPAIVQIQTQPNQISQNQVQIQQIQSNTPTLLPPPPPQIHQHQQQTQIQLQHHQVQNQQQSSTPQQPQQQQQQQQQQQPSVNVTKPTQALKKHHLYFKRQSECFPHGDINIHNNNNINIPITPIKNEITVPMTVTTTATNTIPPVKIETTYPQTSTIVFSSSSSSTVVAAATAIASSSSSLSSSSSSSYTSMTLAPSTYVSTTPASTIHTNAIITPATYMPRHSSAKVTTITTSHSSSLQIPINSTAPIYTSHTLNNTTPSKSPQMLHKIKPESGKIVKHSLDKLNSTVRIKPSDLQDMKHVIKTVDKSYVLTKPTTTITPLNANIINGNNNSNNNNAATTTTGHLQYHQALNAAAAAAAAATTISTGASSPSSVSSTSSSSTKYSDNSSDSGFDENMLDRKSASPLQEDTERKILTRPGLQTMFLSSGVQIQGQHQNIVLTGNEVAAKVMQNRKASTITVTPAPHNSTKIGANGATIMHHHQAHPNNSRPATSVASGTTSAVKIAQIIGTNSMQAAGVNSLQTTTISGGSHVAKMRAIYNNNTIQHENGITTIVPASSLAATTQTAAMNAIPPNTVTITPAPVQHGKKIITNSGATITATNYQNQQHIQNIIATNSTTTINPVISTYSLHQQQQQQQHHHTQQQQQHQHQQQTHLHGANVNHQIGGNQKIILLKTTNGGGLGGGATTTTATKYNTNAIINNNTQNLINKGLLTANNIQTVTVPSAATITAQNSLNSLNVQTTTTSQQNTIIKARP